jgi:hypothetical protein
MAYAAGKRTRAAARSHAESPERTANLGAGGSIVSLALWCSRQAKAAQDTAPGLARFQSCLRGLASTRARASGQGRWVLPK